MEEIKLGEYIRTDKGRIQKIKYFSDFAKITDENGNILGYEYVFHTGYCSFHIEYIEMEKIVKYSPEIIDLIEVGDYVNRRKVTKVFIDPFIKKKRLELEGTEVNWQGDMSSIYCEADDIKSIVTKEMMKSVEYIIEED